MDYPLKSRQLESVRSMNEQNFFCIRGYMKSGTNWLCRILNCHPDIDCIGEFHWESFYQALDQNVANIAPKRRQTLDEAVRPELEQMVRRSLSKLATPSARWIGDRTPTTIAPIVISDAVHFVAVRDFRDVIVSRMFHLYSHPRVTGVFDKYPEMKQRLTQFEANPWYFREHPEELIDNEEIVRTSAREWKQFLMSDQETIVNNSKLKVLRIKYESLHLNFAQQADQMFNSLELDTPTLPSAVRPGHAEEKPNALNRKGQVGDWENYLGAEAKRWINEELSDQLQELGYIQSIQW